MTNSIIYQTDSEKEKILNRFDDIQNLLNFTHINNLSKSIKYHYFYITESYISDIIKETNKLPISEKLIDKCRNYDINIYFVIDAETDSEDVFEVVSEQIKKEGLQEENFTIINGNYKLPILKNKSKSKIKYHISNRLQEMVSKDLLRNNDDITYNKKYIFQCYNGTVKEHRLMILSMLEQAGILHDTNWTFLKMTKNYDTKYLETVFSSELIEKYKSGIRNIINNGAKKSDEENFKFFNPPYYFNYSLAYENNSYKHSYINIVTESQYDRHDTIHVTEKSLVPFYFLQIPIFIATPHHVKYLKDIYGFDLFEDLISHDYDEEIDNNKRIEMVYNHLKNIDTSALKNFYKKESTKNRLLSNRIKVKNLIFNTKDNLYYKSILS